MFKKSLIIGASAAAALLFASAAQAGVSVFYFPLGTGVDNPSGITQIDNFFNDTAGVDPSCKPGCSPLNGPGGTWSGTGGYIQNTGNTFGAIPAGTQTGTPVGPFGNSKGNYLTVPGGAPTETLTLASTTDRYMQLYVGSLDTYNTLTFTLQDNSTKIFTGADLAVFSSLANGNQQIGKTNGYFTFLFDDPIKSVNFASSQNSFEIGEIRVAATPEPETWALMFLGVGLAGAALRLSKRNAGPLLAGA